MFVGGAFRRAFSRWRCLLSWRNQSWLLVPVHVESDGGAFGATHNRTGSNFGNLDDGIGSRDNGDFYQGGVFGCGWGDEKGGNRQNHTEHGDWWFFVWAVWVFDERDYKKREFDLKYTDKIMCCIITGYI